MKPRCADLFCGAGGAAMGLHRAGFEVEGWDIVPQKHYPFKFHLGNALEADLKGFDFAWTSPPCQKFSAVSRCNPHLVGKYPDLIVPTRHKLIASRLPYIIENVKGARLINPVTLCGTMFPPLRVYRHRHFECSLFFLIPIPDHIPHRDSTPRAGYGISPKGFVSVAGDAKPAAYCRQAMGIDWMNRHELSESIPPAYSEFLGRQIIKLL
jgi:DNA (cytosine-5)-methyltransferase 1